MERMVGIAVGAGGDGTREPGTLRRGSEQAGGRSLHFDGQGVASDPPPLMTR